MAVALAFFKPKDVDVLIQLENPNIAITASAGTLAVTGGADTAYGPNPDNTKFGIASRGATASIQKVGNLIGIDMTVDKEKEEVNYFGRVTGDKIFVRRKAEVTLTRKADSSIFAMLGQTASGGLTDGGALNIHDELMTTGSGFRLFIQEKDGEKCYTLQNCVLIDYKPVPSPAKTTEEVMTFVTNIWSVSSSAKTTATADSDL